VSKGRLEEPPGSLSRGAWRAVKAFYWKAFDDNLTGLSAMVAYNLLLSILPLALLALFVAGTVLRSGDIEQSVLDDLQQLFPDAARSTLVDLLDGLQDFSTRLGIAALVASIWIGSSFWGALDTAFCRIYRLECRRWVQQKRFALAMLGVSLLFMLATVAVPALQSLLVAGAENLPFGLSEVRGIVFVLTLIAGLLLLFGCLCLIYWVVPNRSMPWRAIWPGASAATLAIASVDYAFPVYLSGVSTIAEFGTTMVFVVIVLVWFYALAIIMLGAAVVNALCLAGAPTARPE
jgi:YihY family inner membrane protein